MKPEPDQPIACQLCNTGQLVRRALPPVPCPQRFREDLRQKLVGAPPPGARPEAQSQARLSGHAC
ncbi:MAG TPA: hypothetical protein VKV26_14510 [Dehalococcoidia bacterium]|nr:hypothetical protein [Dehalococcoidia bacterium]